MSKELISYIAQSLVDEPGAVEVEETSEAEGSVLKLKVAKDDLGKVIGKKGRTAKAMRAILAAAADRADKKVSLEILE